VPGLNSALLRSGASSGAGGDQRAEFFSGAGLVELAGVAGETGRNDAAGDEIGVGGFFGEAEKLHAARDLGLELRRAVLVFDVDDAAKTLAAKFGELAGGVARAGAPRNVVRGPGDFGEVLEVKRNQAALGGAKAGDRIEAGAGPVAGVAAETHVFSVGSERGDDVGGRVVGIRMIVDGDRDAVFAREAVEHGENLGPLRLGRFARDVAEAHVLREGENLAPLVFVGGANDAVAGERDAVRFQQCEDLGARVGVHRGHHGAFDAAADFLARVGLNVADAERGGFLDGLGERAAVERPGLDAEFDVMIGGGGRRGCAGLVAAGQQQRGGEGECG